MTPAPAIPSKIAGYHVLQILLPPSSSFPQSATHYLYLRPHEPKVPDAATPRSLFLVNVPFDATETHIKHLFSAQLDLPGGRIVGVQFEGAKSKTADPVAPVAPQPRPMKTSKKRKRDSVEENTAELDTDLPKSWDRELHRSGSNAVVIFVDRASMEAAFRAVRKAHKTGKCLTWGEGVDDKVPALGSQRYLTHHTLRYPPQSALLAAVNDYMTAYNARESARVEALARKRQEPDDEGFITVTRGGRGGAVRQEEAIERLEKQKQKQKPYEDFYRFQSRERRKERAGELMKKFEEDREKVRKMRERKGRFRPE